MKAYHYIKVVKDKSHMSIKYVTNVSVESFLYPSYPSLISPKVIDLAKMS